MLTTRLTIPAAALRGMIEGSNKREKAYTFDYGQSNHYTCQNNAYTSKLQMLSTRMTITAAELRGRIEGANKFQKAYTF